MTRTFTFDTLKFVKKLTAAGVPRDQAEAQADAFREAHEENIDSLQDLKNQISDLKIDIIKWVLSIVLVLAVSAQTAIIVSISKSISREHHLTGEARK